MKSDQIQIQEAVKRAESQTSGEIKVVVLTSAGAYRSQRMLMAVLIGVLVAFVTLPLVESTFFHPLSGRFLTSGIALSISIIWCFFVYLVLGLPILQRFFVSSMDQTSRIEQKAFELFSRLGVYKTKDRSGVLILVAECEHQFMILADEGIHERVPQGTWDRLAQEAQTSIRSQGLTQGLCLLIGQVGDLLREKYPRQAADRNELSDSPHFTS